MTDQELEFDLEPDDHRYTFNGKEVPATTRVLSLARPSMENIPKKAVEIARSRGKAVHKAVELHAKDDLDRRELTREVKLRFDRYMRFLDFYKVEIVKLPVLNYFPTFFGGAFAEVPMVHPLWQFGVMPDLGIVLVEGTLSTVEVKVTSTHSQATALQLASQVNTINYFMEKHGYKVEERYSLRLTSDAKPDVRRYRDSSDWATYLSFLNVYNWRRVNKIDKESIRAY